MILEQFQYGIKKTNLYRINESYTNEGQFFTILNKELGENLEIINERKQRFLEEIKVPL